MEYGACATAPIAARGDVMRAPGNGDARQSGHASFLAQHKGAVLPQMSRLRTHLCRCLSSRLVATNLGNIGAVTQFMSEGASLGFDQGGDESKYCSAYPAGEEDD